MQNTNLQKEKTAMDFTYITKPCIGLDDDVYRKCSELYSENYGKYSGEDQPEKKGKPIKMGVSLYKKFYGQNKNMFISLCYKENQLVGHAFFLRKEIQDHGLCSWVTQLIVHHFYRNKGIGSRLLQSAWGFSNYYAWGLATANAITLKTLESVTWREIKIENIKENLSVIENILNEIPFANSSGIELNDSFCQIFSNFYPELETSNNKTEYRIYAKRLGDIKPGNEWLAFTFASQEMSYSDEKFKKFLDFSEKQLQEAYGRMDMPTQQWTQGTSQEVEFILSKVNIDQQAAILDLGCGQGRHSIELLKRGYSKTIGIDFSENLIEKAGERAFKEHINGNFITADARKLKLGNKYDVILCLYDVIGSFREEKDNISILKTIKQHLKADGRAIISVMNMELTNDIALHKGSLKENPKMLLQLPSSNIMANSGNIFNPEYYMINTDDGLVYRREQFDQDGMLSTEYVLADKRYTLTEIAETVQKTGFNICSAQYVQAGHWEKPLAATDKHAKEILLVLSLQ